MRLVAASLLAGAVVACQSGGGPVTGPVTAPVAIKTAPVIAQACMDALLGGRLVVNNQSGLGVASADGQVTAVEWPFGYTARSSLGTIELVNETGLVVARVGDEVQVGGGFGNQFWHACGGVSVVVPGS